MRLIALDDKRELALKAVVYGCNTNKRLAGASFMTGIDSGSPETISFYDALSVINEMMDDTIETEPVVHGRWVQSGQCNHKPYRIRNTDKWTTYKCSVCGYGNGRRFSSKYCPNCGAKMDGEKE